MRPGGQNWPTRAYNPACEINLESEKIIYKTFTAICILVSAIAILLCGPNYIKFLCSMTIIFGATLTFIMVKNTTVKKRKVFLAS